MTVKEQMQRRRNEEMTNQITKAVNQLEEMFLDWQKEFPLEKEIRIDCWWDCMWLTAEYSCIGSILPRCMVEKLCSTRSDCARADIEKRLKKELKKRGFHVRRYVFIIRPCMLITLKLS